MGPTGSVIAFAGNAPPDGWFVCHGAAVRRTDYADLFIIIGTSYGVGDGATTFNLTFAAALRSVLEPGRG